MSPETLANAPEADFRASAAIADSYKKGPRLRAFPEWAILGSKH
jgi:hypothetical protein